MESLTPSRSISHAQRAAKADADKFDQTYTFRVRRHRQGSFAGLWELCLLDEVGRVKKMISDADALIFCMENLMGELEMDGF